MRARRSARPKFAGSETSPGDDPEHDSDAKSASVIGRASTILVFKGVSAGLVALGAILLARGLEPNGRGVLAAATAGPLITSLVLFLGVGVANVYFLARQEVTVPVAIGTSLASAVLVGLVGGAAYVAIGLSIRGSVLHGLPAPYVWLGGLMVPVVLSARYISAIPQGLLRIALLNSVVVTQGIAAVALYFVVLYILRLGSLAALCGYIAAIAIGVVPVLVILTREYGWWRLEVTYAVTAARFGARGEASNFVAYLGYRVDLIIVTAILGFSAAGKYAVAFTLAEILWVLPTAVAAVLFPAVAADGYGAETGIQTTARIARLTCYVLVVSGLLGVLVAPWLLPRIFSVQYRGAVLPLQLLVPGIILYGVGKVLTADLNGRGRPGVNTVSSLATLAVMVGLDFALIPRYGIVGAAAASSFAYALGFFITLLIFMKIASAKAGDILIPKREDLRFANASLRRRRLAANSIPGVGRLDPPIGNPQDAR